MDKSPLLWRLVYVFLLASEEDRQNGLVGEIVKANLNMLPFKYRIEDTWITSGCDPREFCVLHYLQKLGGAPA